MTGVLVATLVFAPLAAAVAFVILYGEDAHHVSRRLAVSRAVRGSIITLAVFLLLGVALAFLLPRIF